MGDIRVTFFIGVFMIEDFEAWEAYPRYHNWFNKLWVSERLGYECGPSGVAPKKSKYYIVRPIYNLSGMGVGAEFKYIAANDYTQVPPGYFWQEIFLGNHYSATYEFVHDTNPYWKPITCFEGVRLGTELWKFTKWKRCSYFPTVPRVFNDLSEIKRINVEFKGDKPIEVHLRDTPDPDYDEFIPIWKGDENTIKEYEDEGFVYIESYDDANGFLGTPRLGFMIR